MNLAIKKGLSFGLASGVVTTLGLIVGLNAGTHSLLAIISGIFVIAVADALSDAMGVHFSEEADKKRKENHIWTATIVTFLAKFFMAISFIVPFLLLPIPIAIILSIIYGMILIGITSYYLAKQRNERPAIMIAQHIAIAIAVIILSTLVGHLAGKIS